LCPRLDLGDDAMFDTENIQLIYYAKPGGVVNFAMIFKNTSLPRLYFK